MKSLQGIRLDASRGSKERVMFAHYECVEDKEGAIMRREEEED